MFADTCPCTILISGFICKPGLPFSQQVGLFCSHFSNSGITVRYLSANMYLATMLSFNIVNLLSIFSAFNQIRLCRVFRNLWFDFGRQCAAARTAASASGPNCGRFKGIDSTFVGIVLIAPVNVTHAALCKRSNSDLAEAVSVPSHHTIAAYVILGNLWPLGLQPFRLHVCFPLWFIIKDDA